VAITAVSGLPEVRAGDDLATLIDAELRHSGFRLAGGDIVVVSRRLAAPARAGE
jgi:F420-0:gamma-glutamyl ligase